MMNLLKAIIPVAVTTLFSACPQPDQPIYVTISPASANVAINQSVQFKATVHNSTSGDVTWSVFGPGCSGAACGTVTSDGLYTAPAVVPGTSGVRIRTISVDDPSKMAEAEVTILPTEEWIWTSGSNYGSQAGIYGTKGTPDAANVPGARRWMVSQTDSSGILWLFGGRGIDSQGMEGQLNDLWKYDPSNDKWTWISGSSILDTWGNYGTLGTANPSNVPGARSLAVSWIDSDNKLWVFGGIGYDSEGNVGALNDLWKFDPNSLNWTWMSGSELIRQPGTYGTKGVADPMNVPGARRWATTWLDSHDKLWLFGGSVPGEDESVAINDLWKYDPTTHMWTWMSGYNFVGQTGIYGQLGVPDSANLPGAREGAVSWIDAQDRLWLFGGSGWSSQGRGIMNDLWKYDPATNQWTWMSGSNLAAQFGFYGTKKVPDTSNVPGARWLASSWTDLDGRLWLFGGEGYSSSNEGNLNDLWAFSPTTLAWVWISGDSLANQTGTYGLKQGYDPLNIPGARSGAASWTDSSGKFWLFGGAAYDSIGAFGLINDLWSYARH